MKKYLIGLIFLLTPFSGMAQAKLSPQQEARMDSLEHKVLEEVGRRHGAGAGVGADGNWIEERQVLEQTHACVLATNSGQTGALLSCFVRLRNLYEKQRNTQVSSVRRLAITLQDVPFLTQDAQTIYLLNWLPFALNTLATRPQVQQQLAQKLNWGKTNKDAVKETEQFITRLRVWHQHLREDTTQNRN